MINLSNRRILEKKPAPQENSEKPPGSARLGQGPHPVSLWLSSYPVHSLQMDF